MGRAGGGGKAKRRAWEADPGVQQRWRQTRRTGGWIPKSRRPWWQRWLRVWCSKSSAVHNIGRRLLLSADFRQSNPRERQQATTPGNKWCHL